MSFDLDEEELKATKILNGVAKEENIRKSRRLRLVQLGVFINLDSLEERRRLYRSRFLLFTKMYKKRY